MTVPSPNVFFPGLFEDELRPSERLAADHIRLTKFVTIFGCGGTERQFVNLGLALNEDYFDLRFGCLKRSGHFLQELEAKAIPATEYSLRSFASAAAAKQMARFARDVVRHRTQVVHSYNFYSNVFAVPAARVAGVPVVIASIRDRGAYLTPAQRRVQRIVCRMADCVLVNAESIKDWLVEDGYKAEKVVVIPNGIDLSRFVEPPPSDLRQAFGIPAEAPIVGVVSRLSRVKGLEYFLDAVAAIIQRHPQTYFVIAGEGQELVQADGTIVEDLSYRAELEERAKRLGIAGRVIFTGYRSDVPSVLRELSISVLPSLTEGLSNSVLESMAAGAPVVATRVGGTPEAITHGVNGLMVPPADTDALAAAISRLLDDPEEAARLGRHARRTVEERFSMDRMVQATAKLYRRLLASKGMPSRRRARIDVQQLGVSR